MRKLARFITLYEDKSAKFARIVKDRVYHVIDFTDLVDACGESEAMEIGGKYSVRLSEVDLDTIPQTQIDSAMQCCGCEDPIGDLQLVEALESYGAGAPLYDNVGNNRNKLLQECREESLELENDSDAHEERMNKPVNAIGSTAREYGQGDIYAAMTRGVCKGDQTAKIMAKMYGATDEVIENAEGRSPVSPMYFDRSGMRKDNIKNLDAFIAGFTDAIRGEGKRRAKKPGSPSASGYLEGYKHAVAYKAHDAPKPEWLY